MEEAKAKLELISQFFADINERQWQQLAALGDLYKEWNVKINVISRKDIDGLYEKHVLHSLSIAAAFEFKEGSDIIDIGTGGGFPGIPLAIFFPGVKFHLVDSIGKKIRVVEAVAKAIGLDNLTTQHSRAEDIKGRKFDCAVSRAVAPIKELWAWSKPLLRKTVQNATQGAEITPKNPNGLICLKGGDLANEISESGTRPAVEDIFELFPLSYFKDKYILYIQKTAQ